MLDFENLFPIGMLAVSVFCWCIYLVRRRVGHDLIPDFAKHWAPWGIIDVWIAFTMKFGFMVLLMGFASAIYGDIQAMEQPSKSLLLYSIVILSNTALISAMIAYLIYRFRSPLSELGFSIEKIGEKIKLGLFSSVMVIPPVLLIQYFLTKLIPYSHPTVDSLKNGSSSLLLGLTAFSAIVVAPLVEEFLFRVVLQGGIQSWLRMGTAEIPQAIYGDPSRRGISSSPYGEPDPSDSHSESNKSASEKPDSKITISPLRAKFDTVVPILMSAAIFASFHIGQGAAPIPLFFFGLGLGYLYHRTHSIYPCLILHVVLNAWSVAILLLGSVP